MGFATSVASRWPRARISLVLVLARLNAQVLARRFSQLRLQRRNFPQALVDLLVRFIQTWRARHLPPEHIIQVGKDKLLPKSATTILPCPQESDLNMAVLVLGYQSTAPYGGRMKHCV